VLAGPADEIVERIGRLERPGVNQVAAAFLNGCEERWPWWDARSFPCLAQSGARES
jgi:hypothetical protein